MNTAIGYVIAGLAALLLTSLAGNAFLGRSYLKQRDSTVVADERRATAVESARLCSQGVDRLNDAISGQRAQHEAAIEAARLEGIKAGKRAQAERSRKQAVPGDVCASAKAENDEWYQNRRARHGR